MLLTELRHFRGLIRGISKDQWIHILLGEVNRLDISGLYIVSVDVNTGAASDVVPGIYALWSPDGTRIAVLGRYDGGGYLATVAPDGSDFRVLVNANEDGGVELAAN